MKDQNSLLLNVSILYRNINKYFDKYLLPYNLSSAQMIALLTINEQEGISMQQLAQYTKLDKGTVTKCISKLVESNYVKIVVDETDKRVKHLYTTIQNPNLINELYTIRNNGINQLTSNVDEAANSSLKKLMENIELLAGNSYQRLRIGGLQKLTLLDYPGKVACTIFLTGCNFKCPFCHNKDLVFVPEDFEFYDPDDILEYLAKRKGILEGVCFTGGEALLQSELLDYMKQIKELGYLIKLDTNGQNPDLLKKAIDEKLVDYVAMDIKNTWDKYSETVGYELSDIVINRLKQSVDLLKSNVVDYEFRTTVVKTYHTESDLVKIAEELKGCKVYYLQTFKNSGNLIDSTCEGYSEAEMKALLESVKNVISNVQLRE